MMKCEIITINTIFNDDLTINCYELVTHMKDKPELRLGECDLNEI